MQQVTAGDLAPGSAPASTMHTIEEVYQKATGGQAPAGSLDPTNAPAPTMHTLEDIYQALDPIQRLSPTTTVVKTGYYAVTNLTEVETDLAGSTIVTNTTVFGINGLFTGTTLITNALAAVAKTGQTTSYAAGDDGDLTNGVPEPGTRFTDNSDGTISDNLTGLIWLKNANAFGTTNWGTAVTNCNTLNSGEHGLSDGSAEGDWRLPNIHELESLTDYGFVFPALPTGHPFTGAKSSYYWSSTTYPHTNPTDAWFMNAGSGQVSYSATTSLYYVWPVKGGL